MKTRIHRRAMTRPAAAGSPTGTLTAGADVASGGTPYVTA